MAGLGGQTDRGQRELEFAEMHRTLLEERAWPRSLTDSSQALAPWVKGRAWGGGEVSHALPSRDVSQA